MLVVVGALVVGCAPLGLSQQTEWLFAPPWALSDWKQWSSGNPGDRIVDVRINPTDGKGTLGFTWTPSVREGMRAPRDRSPWVEGSSPPMIGVYEFVFLYE